MNFGGQWDTHLPLIKFAYNSYHVSIEMAAYEALYRRKCRSPLCWDIGERQLLEPKIGANNFREVSIIQQRWRITFNRQKSFTDPKR